MDPFSFIDFPFHPPTVAAVRIPHRDIIRPLTGNLEARFFENADHLGPVPHVARLDARQDVVRDLLPVGCPRKPLCCPLNVPCPSRVIGTRPPVFGVQRVPERVVERFPAGGSDVERLAAPELDARRHEVKLDPAALGVRVANPQDVVLVLLKARERGTLEFLDDFFLLRLARIVLGREAQHPRRVAVLAVDAVDQVARLLRVSSTQDFRKRKLPALFLKEVVDWPGPASRAAWKELNQHHLDPFHGKKGNGPPGRSQPAVRSRPSPRPHHVLGLPSEQAG